MGNNVSVEQEQNDTWWPPPNAELIAIDQNSQTDENKISPDTSETQIHITDNKSNTLDEPTASSSSVVQRDETDDDETNRKSHRELKMQQFRSDLEKKHLARREAIAERSREILFLREELVKYKQENEQLKEMLKQNTNSEELNETHVLNDERNEIKKLQEENDELQNKITLLNEDLNKSQELAKQNSELRINIAETQKDLQAINAQVLEFEKERFDYQNHVVALKDVIRVSKQLLQIRENQLQELKTKVADIENSLAERETTMMSTDLKVEYEKQLNNIRALRKLYEERQAATKAERDLMASQLTDAKNNFEFEQKKNSELQERVTELETNISDKYDEIKNLESQLGLAKAEFRGLEAEMSVINQLFSQILFGFKNCKEIDFDKLIKLLEQNHGLLTDIVENEESQELSSALPKVLLDLVNQVNEENKNSESDTENSEDFSYITHSSSGTQLPTIPEENLQQDQQCTSNKMNSAEEIVNNLPKVWRVLIELLRQQSGQQPVDINGEDADPCYKSVQTPKGPKLVLSVSKTFIRLKDLILEKKSLEKEMTRLKQLNTHLEGRLSDQEKRLETVSTELSKTWHVVGRMQRQHQQLHTHEKILRYELAQKRKMLTELKQELEYCREKWEQAREKNSNTEEEWKKLRTEFASRKTAVVDDLNNSAESGYSDERECSSDDDTSYNTDKRNMKIPPKANDSSDTDDNDLSSHRSDLEDNVQKPDEHQQEDEKKEQECEDAKLHSETTQKTDVEVQNETERKTEEVQTPASLEQLDSVNAFVNNTVDTRTSEPESKPSTSQETSSTPKPQMTQDEMLSRREARLKRLEEQCQQLVTKVTNTTNRSTQICNRLETLHEQYGTDRSNVSATEQPTETETDDSSQEN